MYKWISRVPYGHHNKWRVWFRGVDGKKCHHTFDTEDAASAFIEEARTKLLGGGGHPIGQLVDQYLDSRRSSLKSSTIRTLGYRLGTVIQGRKMIPVEAFPWRRAWFEHVVAQSADSQFGIRAAANGLVAYCLKAGLIKRDPLVDVEVEGRKKRGKKQLHIDEAKRFVEEALKNSDDPMALACAAMVYTGLRPGEIMGLQVRDLDADGTVLWVEKSKTEAGKRTVEVAKVFRPFLEGLTKDRHPEDFLFEFKAVFPKPCGNERKQRLDVLLRRTRSLCKSAGLPVVCAHSMRGLHSTLAAGFGATGQVVAKALGHTSFSVTKRHYVDREVLENANLRSNLQVLQGGQKAVTRGRKVVTAKPRAA